ncbi:MAG TPA: hypothetical protein VFN87_20235 [Solirubrobacteraceae bacterium]|nr:hypothetical protein [Solirubrobacteraceae bacterium]
MPLVIHPRVRKTVGRIAATTCVALFASTGAALAACPPQPVSTPFSSWGDASSYFMVPGGSFEGTADQVGWSLSDASLTTGNAPDTAAGASGDQSLTIAAGGSATSPAFCFDSAMPYLRFFARQTEPGSDLLVEGLVGFRWRTLRIPVAAVADGSMPAWAPVQQIALPVRLLPAWARISVQLRFAVPGDHGAWQVDDVYVDPFRAG